jgi:hypothetical protein
MSDPRFRRAQQQYARIRAAAYRLTAESAVVTGLVAPPVRMADCDRHALSVWRTTWKEPHFSGSGGWNWESLLRRAWRDPAALHLALWSERTLCGLVVGRASRPLPDGRRLRISIECMESAPVLDHPLRGVIAFLAIDAAERYGRAFGAERLRIVEPLPGVLGLYARYGFAPVWEQGHAVYCERRIEP